MQDNKPLLWITDIHTDKKTMLEKAAIANTLASYDAKALLITGDIGENIHTEEFLSLLDKNLSCPIYFVLGNHDFYLESIFSFSQKMALLSANSQHLIYLPSKQYILLDESVALVGIDNWYLLSESFYTAAVSIPDYDNIEDLKGLTKVQLVEYFEEKTKQSCAEIEKKLLLAFEKVSHVLVLMHVPPFGTTAFYEPEIAHNQWEPFSTNRKIGEFLVSFLKNHPGKSIEVLSGHTHNAAAYFHNEGQLISRIGAASDGSLHVQAVSDFERISS